MTTPTDRTLPVLPQALARSRRGICPTCGVPLQLRDSEREVGCDFCGGRSALEYRLRTLEPDLEGERPKQTCTTRWIRRFGDTTCPGCGASFECDRAQAIQRCVHCGSESKLERRLRSISVRDLDPPRERTRMDLENESRDQLDHPWDVETEQLIWRILNEPDPLGRVHLARNFQNSGYINATSAHFLPFLLAQMQCDQDAVAYRIGDVVGKLLCQSDHPFNLDVLQASEAVIYDLGGSRCLLSELGLGDGVCIKILLDAAQAAAERGDRDYACHALWGVNTIFGRNFPQHQVMAQIVLYRMFYLTGPVLGWALFMFENGFHLGIHLPTEELLEVMDELVQERPDLAPALRRSFYSNEAKTPELFRQRLEMARDLTTPEARAAACEQLQSPPTRDKQLLADAISILEGQLDHPATFEPAGLALRRLLDERPGFEPMHDLIRRRGDTLPERLRAGFCRKFPDQDLIDPEPVKFWQPKRDTREEAEAERLERKWRAGISAAVDQYQQDREAARPMLDAADELDLPIFTNDGPATIPLRSGHG